MKLKPFIVPRAASKDWIAELNEILSLHNGRHAVKDKDVSYKTREDRCQFYFALFRELRRNEDKTFKLMPRNLDNRHVQFMVNRWLKRGVAPGTLQLYFSYLRTFCEWINKPGMIETLLTYVTDPDLVTRIYTAAQDRSWTASGVVPAEKIAEIKAFDPYVGCQLQMQLRHGMRRKESIMCQPHLAQLPAGTVPPDRRDPALPADMTYLEVGRGTKGGRLRYVAIDSADKREALEEAKRLVTVRTGHLGRPGKTLAQNMRRFNYVMAKFGVTRAMLGITAHGLRHEYGNDRYEKHSGEASPVRGGGKIDRERDRDARLKVADELGHSREGITGAYLGGVLKREPGEIPADPPASQDEASSAEECYRPETSDYLHGGSI